MSTVNPVTHRPYVHFPRVPSGGRLACGQNACPSTPMNNNSLRTTCPDCLDQIHQAPSPQQLQAKIMRLNGFLAPRTHQSPARTESEVGSPATPGLWRIREQRG